jgi:purine nucleosidase
MEFFRETYRRHAGFDSPPVHDPCAVARVIDPTVMECVDAFVAVETRGEWSAGMTVTDFSGRLGHPPNAKVATTLNVERFWNLMVDALQRIGASPG